jgi:uncharacterized membrane protein
MDPTPPSSGRGALLRAAAIFAAGLACLAVTPPFQVPDAVAHFDRIQQISRGEVIPEKRGSATGGMVPAAIEVDAARFHGLIFHPEARITFRDWQTALATSPSLSRAALVYGSFSNTSLYAPPPYLPQAAAVAIARVAGWTDLAAYYFAGFCALATCSALLFLAFRALDFSWRFTNVCFLLAGMPMSLFLIGSISADGPIICLSFLAFALALRMRETSGERTFFALVATSVLLGLCKGLYALVPMGILPLAMPAVFRRDHVQRALPRAAVLIAAAAVPAGLWSVCTHGLFSVANPLPGIDPSAQLRYIAAHPLHVAWLYAATVVRLRTFFLKTFIGQLGWLDTTLPHALVGAYAVGLVLASLGDRQVSGQSEPGAAVKAWMLAACVASVAAILTFEYLTWVPVGSSQIDGAQGRYFIPLAPLALAALPRLWRLPERWLPRSRTALWLAWSGAAALTVLTLARRYWA